MQPWFGKAKPKTCLGKGKSKPGKALADEPKERGPWVDLKQTDANKPQPRSYLQGRVEGGKLHLIVEVAQHMSTHYLSIIGKIRCALEKDNLSLGHEEGPLGKVHSIGLGTCSWKRACMQLILGKGPQCSWKRTCNLALEKDHNVLGKDMRALGKGPCAAEVHQQF